ncbi:hypothetical protein Agabi119p4_11053 [Agaricus bisporus var. burnettii]|uniref:Uncharacterized protein n=1 Tax=Agaricus bisporus var. burnettii TaxID=192524 RepID=A0A8H7EVX9_AGABI|nr:hypothetical protein Agabi119p4_11053 [Agaricus bisporus var. burnettii]
MRHLPWLRTPYRMKPHHRSICVHPESAISDQTSLDIIVVAKRKINSHQTAYDKHQTQKPIQYYTQNHSGIIHFHNDFGQNG